MRCFIIYTGGCAQCENCIDNCPTGALDCCGEEAICYDNEICIGCGNCVKACPCDCLKIEC